MNRHLTAKFMSPPLGRWLTPGGNSFAMLRLVLALAVLVSHAVYLGTGASENEPMRSLFGYSLGEHAVQAFFVLSGILVTQSLMTSRSVGAFGAARGLRIFPALIVCVGLTALVLGPLVSELAVQRYFRDGRLWHYLAATLSLSTGSAALPSVFTGNPVPEVVNSSLWTLKYEVICYILLAVAGGIALWFQRVGQTAGTGLALSLAVFATHRPNLLPNNGFLDQVIYFWLFFGTGVLIYALREHVRAVGLLILPLAVVAYALRHTEFLGLALAPLVAMFVLSMGSLRLKGLREITNEVDLSYGTYIYGVPVSQTLLVLWPHIGVARLILFSVVFTLGLALLSWAIVEAPAIAYGRRLARTFKRAPSRDRRPRAMAPLAALRRRPL